MSWVDWTAQYEAAERARDWLRLAPLAAFVFLLLLTLGILLMLKRH